jgi:hypothetical protein
MTITGDHYYILIILRGLRRRRRDTRTIPAWRPHLQLSGHNLAVRTYDQPPNEDRGVTCLARRMASS